VALMASAYRRRLLPLSGLVVCAAAGLFSTTRAEEPPSTEPALEDSSAKPRLTQEQREQLDMSVSRALAWLATQQREDGSFPTLEMGQPAVTALCVMAFLSAGHVPGEGRYGPSIEKATEYVLRCQHPDGLIARQYPSMPMNGNDPPQTAMYNHAISGLMLSEVYGMTRGPASERVHKTLESALSFTRKRQLLSKRHPADNGGWRYFRPWQDSDADLSVTSWQLMFMRSCRNAGFEVPSGPVDEALAFVRRCHNPNDGTFWYALRGAEHVTTRAMVGAGILSLSLGGRHQTEEALRAGRWVLAHPFDKYRGKVTKLDRFFYGSFYCSQAMFQLGGKYWTEFYPPLLHTLSTNQRPDGSWDREDGTDGVFGNMYTTALVVLALTPPNELLPVFQR
jgi:hypothetical protein